MEEHVKSKFVKRHKKPAHKGWLAVLVVMVCFGFGFLGGWVAIRVSGNIITGSNSSQQIVLKESEVIADVVEKVSPSVVTIQVTSEVTQRSVFGPQTSEQNSEGSGIILSEDGLVVTNKHVVADGAKTVTITTDDGKRFNEVEIIGRDPLNDIAFLRINNASGLTAAKLGDSDAARVGDKVIAIGNALGEFDNTVTAGIVSGLGRPIDNVGTGEDAESLQNLLQTDTAINPGNSGGPLVNINGEVIGINTAIVSDAQNIGFAIPINDVKTGIESVEQTGKLERPYLGVNYYQLSPEAAAELKIDQEQGVLVRASNGVSAVIKDGPADKAGVRDGDIITKVDNQTITEKTQLRSLIGKYRVGDTVKLTIIRDGSEITIDVTLEAAPENLGN